MPEKNANQQSPKFFGQDVFSLLSAEDMKTHFLRLRSSKILVLANVAMALIYFAFIAIIMPKGNHFLFYLLIVGEIFHLWQIATYAHTVWQLKYEAPKDEKFMPEVDVYITVAGEPAQVVEETARAALRMDYPKHRVYILNDGLVAGKDNWEEIENLAAGLNITCITRRIPGGAKAGNINNALRETASPFVAIFDADQAPHSDFLKKTLPYFVDDKMGFVQTPQFYKNYSANEITRGAWEQQQIFFGAVCEGKNRLNSAFMCGTNMVMRRQAIEQVGGMSEESIAEDFLTSLFIHEKGWKSFYVSKVLAEGLAPEDFKSYYRQQFRWARGSLELIFKYNPLFRKGTTFSQKIQYLSSASFYLSGFIVLLDALLPLVFFFTGKVPLLVSSMGLAAVFLPYIFLTVTLLKMTTNSSLTFRAVAFSMSSFTIHLKAIWATLTGKKNSFEVTSKKRLSGNFLNLVAPHLAYLGLTLAGVAVAIGRDGFTAAFLSNLAWAMFNCCIFLMFIAPAFSNSRAPQAKKIPVKTVAVDLTNFQNPNLSSQNPNTI